MKTQVDIVRLEFGLPKRRHLDRTWLEKVLQNRKMKTQVTPPDLDVFFLCLFGFLLGVEGRNANVTISTCVFIFHRGLRFHFGRLQFRVNLCHVPSLPTLLVTCFPPVPPRRYNSRSPSRSASTISFVGETAEPPLMHGAPSARKGRRTASPRSMKAPCIGTSKDSRTSVGWRTAARRGRCPRATSVTPCD